MVKLHDKYINTFEFILAARFGRSPASASSNDTHSSTQWLPNAEEYRMYSNPTLMISYILDNLFSGSNYQRWKYTI